MHALRHHCGELLLSLGFLRFQFSLREKKIIWWANFETFLHCWHGLSLAFILVALFASFAVIIHRGSAKERK